MQFTNILKMKHFSIKIALLSVLAALAACTGDDYRPLAFVGDSHVARWDVQASFPSFATENHGISGRRLDYIESKAHAFKGKDLVVIIGTNDVMQLEESVEEYAERYVDAIAALGAERTFLFSIFPRSSTVWKDGSEKTAAANAAIRRQLEAAAPDIVYIDVFPDLLDEGGGLNPNLSCDGVHLNSYGYEILTSKLIEQL